MSEQFNNDNLKTLEADVKKALSEVEKKHGVTISVEVPRKYYYYTSKMTLTFQKPAPYADEYRRVGAQHGLKPEWLGKKFWVPGGSYGAEYRILGLKDGAVIAAKLKKNVQGNPYSFRPEDVVKRMTDGTSVSLRYQ
jgi:hypothetical protein